MVLTLLRSFVCQVHAAIRENPTAEKKERSKPSETKNWKAKKLTYDERKQKLKVCCTPLSQTLHTCKYSFWGAWQCGSVCPSD